MARNSKNKKMDPNIRDEMGEDTTPIKLWCEEIEDAKRHRRDWVDSCDRIVKRYRNEEDDASNQRMKSDVFKVRRYNVLWSIMQTLKPLVYGQAPVPYISRAHLDRDPVGRDSSMILQRSLTESLENKQLHDALDEACDDYLLTSRGVVWAKYTPYMQLRKVEKDYMEGVDLPEGKEVQYRDDGSAFYVDSYEEKVFEEVEWEHVHFSSFLHGAAAKWKHVPWVARMVPMTRSQLCERFGDIGKKPPLTINARQNKNKSGSSTNEDRNNEDSDDHRGLFAKAEVWEIWCKEDKKVRWICPQYTDSFLDEKSDILELENFFPCPRPAYGTKTNDSLIPVPDYRQWQDIAMELDDVTQRIKLLTESLRVVGIYDKRAGSIVERITKQTAENDMIPVDSYAMLQERGGVKGAIEWFPIEQVVSVLQAMYTARRELVQELYEITGVSDIVRGASDPRETARAQSIKGQFANKRLGTKQNTMLRMAKEAMEIESEIMCRHYSPKTFQLISSASQVLTDPVTNQPSPERLDNALRLLKDNTLRQFRVKVDEQNLALPDITEHREEKIMWIQSMSQYITSAMQAMEANPNMGPLLGEILLFGTRAFPMSRTMESNIERFIEDLKSSPPPAPEQEQKSGKTPDEIAVERERNAIAREKNQISREKDRMDYRIKLLELARGHQQDQQQNANRERESELREAKQYSDAIIRADQVDAQREASKEQRVVDLVKWAGDKEQQAAEHQDKITLDEDKIYADLRKAFAPKPQSREAA